MLGLDGNYFSPGPKGVVRLTQVDTETCLVEGTLDGLSPGLHGLAHVGPLGWAGQRARVQGLSQDHQLIRPRRREVSGECWKHKHH